MSNSSSTRLIHAGDHDIRITESGDPDAPAFVFLHGWPESSYGWNTVLGLAGETAHAVAVDLPGIGGSGPDATGGSKVAVARVIRAVIDELSLTEVTLVGHDAGGMVAYAYARTFDDLHSLVILDTVVPGVDPWTTVLSQPYIWHFAFHTIPQLPEDLVIGRQREYFDFFFDTLAADPGLISADVREASAAAYGNRAALTAGFDHYRAMAQDATDNAEFAKGDSVHTPFLYVRGAARNIDIAPYEAGFRDAGMTDIRTAVIPNVGHFLHIESPVALWETIHSFRDSA